MAAFLYFLGGKPMKLVKKLVCLLLCLCLTAVLPVSVQAQENVTPYVQRMIQYYLHYQQSADAEIETLLNYIESVDPGQGSLWRGIMNDWRWSNEEMPVNRDVLPDGLPQDDSLCIVILGYGLRDDGSMKEELIDRLVVGLASALKYPNAYVCVTGGPTANDTKDTEAGQMVRWLMDKGLEPGRILVEDRSLSTTANAQNVFKVLRSKAPQVDSVAVVSSDYHIPWGVSMFTTMSHYASYYDGDNIKVVANAANTTGNNTNTLYSQAWGISIIHDIPFSGDSIPAQYATKPPVEETQPRSNEEVVIEEEDHSWMLSAATPLGAALLGLAAGILLISAKKKNRV